MSTRTVGTDFDSQLPSFFKKNTNFNKNIFANFFQKKRDYLKGGNILGIWLLLLLYSSTVYYIY